MINNKLAFTTKDSSGKELKLAVKKPSIAEAKELNKAYNLAWKEALDSDGILRARIEEVARQQKIWDETKNQEYVALQKKLAESEMKLKAGGNAGLTKKKAKDLAISMIEIRNKMVALRAPLNDLDSNTVESQAENARFNHSVALCTVDASTGAKYFKSYEDYIEKLNEAEPATLDAIKHMSFLTYNLSPDFEANRPEFKFLKEHGFVNDKLRLVDKQGRLVDSEGRLLREDGRFINEKGELIDDEGKVVDEDGNYKVEFKDFLPDEDEEVVTKDLPVVETKLEVEKTE